MKTIRAFTLFLAAAATGSAYAESDDTKLLNAFHKFGITKCNSFILENSKLKNNWDFFMSKHAGGIDGPTTEVSIITIWGSENDTVKTDSSYIQTPNNCYLYSRLTVTNPGSCESNIDGNIWYISNGMPGKDYTTYTNKGGIEMQAKEINVGNFKACIHETTIRKNGKHG